MDIKINFVLSWRLNGLCTTAITSEEKLVKIEICDDHWKGLLSFQRNTSEAGSQISDLVMNY